MSYDAGLLQRCQDALEQAGIRPVRDKNVFGMRGLLLGNRMFAAVGEEGIIVKLRREELAQATSQPGVRPFRPDPDSDWVLGAWIEVDEDVIADDPELRDWLVRGAQSVR